MASKSLRIGIVAGEVSGDIIGADFIRAIKQRYPDAEFEGIGGEQMQAAGCRSLFPLERLSVMGFTEVIARLPELLSIRKQLVQHFRDNPPDVFIGVDAPDFNLTLERKLKQAGIATVHYVSPSVWAWRSHRVKKIIRSTDLMLCLFPFEQTFYQRVGMAVEFVGHPLADEMDLQPRQDLAREALELSPDYTWVALLPGSRGNEVKRLGRVMLETAMWLKKQMPQVRFVAPMATAKTRHMFEQQLQAFPGLGVRLIDGRSRTVMQAADVILLASGTATLEAALAKKPMVVCYRLSGFSYWLMKRLAQVQHIALPNLLLPKPVVPEFIQDQAQPNLMGAALLRYLKRPEVAQETVQQFYALHESLRQRAGERAAAAVLNLVGK